jgi:hypothetical protein
MGERKLSLSNFVFRLHTIQVITNLKLTKIGKKRTCKQESESELQGNN